jgi:hypothetical protein
MIEAIEQRVHVLEWNILKLAEQLGTSIEGEKGCLVEYKIRLKIELARKTKGKNANEMAILGSAWHCLTNAKTKSIEGNQELALYFLTEASKAYGAVRMIFNKVLSHSEIKERNSEYLKLKSDFCLTAKRQGLDEPTDSKIAFMITKHLGLPKRRHRNIRRIISTKIKK